MSASSIRVELKQLENYRFSIDFGQQDQAWVSDEPPPLGGGQGPSPSQLLAAAVGNCLSDSLLFALRKFKQSPEPIRTEVTAEIGRNAEGRLRVLNIHVSLHLGKPESELEHLDRVLGQFEAFCTVSQSVGQGVPILTKVFDAHGLALK